MTTLVFCTSYIESERVWNERYRRWLDHHLATRLQHASFVIIDDGSPFIPTDIAVIPSREIGRVPLPSRALVRFESNLGRALMSFPGWWRSFAFASSIAQSYGFSKIVHIESDAYVLSDRAIAYMDAIDSGWTSFWCPSLQMPESALQVLGHDSLALPEQMFRVAPRGLVDLMAEWMLPFTKVEKSLSGDRIKPTQSGVNADDDYAVDITPGTQLVTFAVNRLHALSRCAPIEPWSTAPVVGREYQSIPSSDADPKAVNASTGISDGDVLRQIESRARGFIGTALGQGFVASAGSSGAADAVWMRANLAATLLSIGVADRREFDSFKPHAVALSRFDVIDDAQLAADLGNFFCLEGQTREALRCYGRALGHAPQSKRIRSAITKLEIARGGAGWETLFDVLHQCAAGPGDVPATPMPGASEATCQRQGAIVHAESLGETLIGLRWMALLQQRGIKAVLWLHGDLAALAGHLGGLASSVSATPPEPQDFQCTSAVTVPGLIAMLGPSTSEFKLPYYLRGAGPSHRAIGARQAGGPPVIGFCFCANPGLRDAWARTVPMAFLAPLAAIEASWVELAAHPDDYTGLREIFGPYEQFDERANPLEEGMRRIAAVDLVLAVDSDAARLAAGMGKSTFVILGPEPNWQWQIGGDAHPWWPNVEIVRAARPQDFGDPVGEAARRISRFLLGVSD